MINYVTGDATNPQGEGTKVIAHICNNRKGWGKGFVLAISKRWAEPERIYRTTPGNLLLGVVQMVNVESGLYVANMIAQDGYASYNRPLAVSYEALRECLVGVATQARILGATVHMPRMGCGLAGSSWDKIEPIVAAAFQTVHVFVYDLP